MSPRSRDPKAPPSSAAIFRVVRPTDPREAELDAPRPAQGTYGGLTMVCSPAEAKRRLEEMQAFVQSAMVPGEDYMVIPGTGDDRRPSLLQPGAQKLAEIYGFASRFLYVAEVEDWHAGFFYYRVRCALTHRMTGAFVGDGVGSANSREKQFAARWVQAKDVPAWLDRKALPTKEKASKFAGGKPYTVYQVPNEADPADLVNVLQKRACKRALVHAVLSSTRSSGLFTQDREELPAEVYGVVEDERPWERAPDVAPEPPAPSPSPSVVHRDVKPGNIMTVKEAHAVELLGPELARAGTKAEIEAIRRQLVLAADGKRPSPAYWSWYQEAVKQAYAAIGAAAPRRGGTS